MESEFGGYAGRFLRVDLTKERLSNVVFDEQMLRSYLGGTGIGIRILYDEVSPDICWSDPSNRVIIASGPLGGTIFPGSGTISLVMKGAMTNGATSVQANGFFGPYLKFSGYDGLILQGKADRWLYLHIEDNKTELKDASHLVGIDTYSTGEIIRKELGKKDREISTISIGPAGEKIVRFAGVFVDRGHSASHNGSGAVLGSKKLKAIVVARGKRRFPVYDEEKLKKLKTRGGLSTIGNVYGSYHLGWGTLPIKNYQTNIWTIEEKDLNKFSEEYIRENFRSKRRSCWRCSADHCNIMWIPNGKYKDMLVEEPEYEQLAAWGPLIDNQDINSAFMLAGLCDRLGMDNNEVGWLIGWIMECYEKGYLAKSNLEGLDMSWGNVESVRKLLHLIASRKGCGNWLAEGVMRASKKIGGEAEKCAIYTKKGNTPRCHDHRSKWGELFDTAVSNTGTIETHTSAMSQEAAGIGNPQKTSLEVASTKGLMALEDSVGTCRFHTWLNAKLISEAVSAATGWNFTEKESRIVGLRIVNLMKAFNVRCGIRRQKDYPSERYSSTPRDGPSKGISIVQFLDSMLDNYYSLMGWDVKTGKPLPKILRKLGLESVIKDIW